MAQIIQHGLTTNELEFCKQFEKKLLNKHTATFSTINEVAEILGLPCNTSCPSCSRDCWYSLLNKYNQLAVEYNKSKIEEPIYTKYESSLEDVKIENEPEKKPLQKASVKNNRNLT